MGSKGETGNDGQQKQLKRKWDTIGATGWAISLNALKMLRLERVAQERDALKMLTRLECVAQERQQKIAGKCYKFEWGIWLDPIPDTCTKAHQNLLWTYIALQSCCSSRRLQHLGGTEAVSLAAPPTYCRSCYTLCQTVPI